METITILVDQRTHLEHGGAIDMQDDPTDWRRALEMLAAAPEGVTDAALLAHGFKSTVVIGLVKSGLANSVTERIWAGRCQVEVRWLWLTESGRKALGR